MKFSSTAKLRLVTLGIATSLTVSIGVFVTVQSYQGAIQQIDEEINSTVLDAKQAPNQELSAALFHIEEYSLDVSLILISRDGSVTTVNDSTIKLFNDISLSQARRATSQIRDGSGLYDFRYGAHEISGGDYLVVAASSDEAHKRLKTGLLTVVLITFITSVLAFFLLSLYIRRLKRRDDALALEKMQAFLGDASHELRTPLTVIKGYVEMLSKGMIKSEEDAGRAFERVTSEIGRMEALIHDLLLLAELGENAQRDVEAIDLSSLVKAHSEDFATLHPERTVEISVIDEIKVLAVRDYLSRFIQNALNNISRHTGAAVPVKISLQLTGKSALLTIEDGGEGLPESAYRDNIRSLNRFDKSRSRGSGGSGLGMSIMAGVVAKQNGKLTLRKSSLGGLAIEAELPTFRELK